MPPSPRLPLLVALSHLATAVSAAAPTGVVQFVDASRRVSEDAGIVYLGLERVGGHAGAVTATIGVEDSRTDAVAGQAYEFNDTDVSWTAGDAAPKAIAVAVLDNAVHNVASTITFFIRGTWPSSAKGVDLQETTLTLEEDGDAGVIRFSAEVVYTRELPAQTQECLVWADRAGGHSGQASLRVELASCERGKVGFGMDATSKLDYMFQPQQNPILWDDGENDTRCLLHKTTSFDELVPNASSIFVLPDVEIEGDEVVCLRAEASGAAQLGADHISVVFTDEEVPPAEWVVIMGKEITIPYAPLQVQPGDIIYFKESCTQPCALVHTEYLKITVGPEDAIEFGRNLEAIMMQLHHTFKLCVCQPGVELARSAGVMQVVGPHLDTVHGACWKGSPSCNIFVQYGGMQMGVDHLQIKTSCEQPDRVAVPFSGQTSTLTGFDWGDGDIMEFFGFDNTTAAASAEVGSYFLCWCTPRSGKSCTNATDFDVWGGTFLFNGPYFRSGVVTHMLGDALVLEGVYGVGLGAIGPNSLGKMRLQPRCGQDEGYPVQGNVSRDTSTYNFGTLDVDRVRASRYRLCWCAAIEVACDKPEHYVADIGEVEIRCSGGLRDMDGDGLCETCRWAWQAPDAQGRYCEAQNLSLMMAILGNVLLFTALLALLMQLEPAGGLRKECVRLGLRAFCLKGRVIYIEDISLERNVLMVTTTGPHYLNGFGRSIPVTLQGTGHFMLDSTRACAENHRVIADGPCRLQLLDLKGAPSPRADASMGTLQFSIRRSLMNTCVARVISVGLFVPVAAGAGIWIQVFLKPLSRDLLILLVSLVCAPVIVIGSKLSRRIMPSLQMRLKQYERSLDAENPEPQACERGPLRAVSAGQLFDLFDFFKAYIQDRTMYYLDPNMVHPLTARHQLSYAERVGPHLVQWFVSHYWGTPFRHFCETVKRHADATCASGGPDAWTKSTYWICTFSNNQHRVSQELGGTLKESSFYLALRSDSCRGTAMILDEKALPLGRSWCLFELLQTILIKRERKDDFQGLLFCTTTGVLNYGACSVKVAMSIGRRLADIDLENADATSVDDKKMINKAVLEEMHTFDAINTELRKFIAFALKNCKDHVNSDFELVGAQLSKQIHRHEEIQALQARV